MMERLVLPELLDGLPPNDAGARANRRDLRGLNRFFGTSPWFREILGQRVRSNDRLLEIGAGEGCLIHDLHNSLSQVHPTGLAWVAIDRAPVFRKNGAAVAFVVADLLHYGQYDRADVVFGNMILHQFKDRELENLGAELNRKTRLLVFQEPVRNRVFQMLSRVITLPMCRVSRHDAAVSVRAGFQGEELPRKLGLREDRWNWELQTTVRGMYRMVAERT